MGKGIFGSPENWTAQIDVKRAMWSIISTKVDFLKVTTVLPFCQIAEIPKLYVNILQIQVKQCNAFDCRTDFDLHTERGAGLC